MTSDTVQLELKVKGLLATYYEQYYRVQLSLHDWADRVQSRLREEEFFAEPNLRKVEDWMKVDFKSKKVLVVGAGTGAELIAFHRRGAEAHGIEPYEKAMQIIKLKAELYGLPSSHLFLAPAEAIPYEDNSFDFVYCYTVLEHVQDVEKSIDEMLRVCKTDGLVYIQTPDYRFPYEAHYKISRLPFSPKWLTALQLLLQGRSPAFLATVNMVTAPQLDSLLMKRNVVVIRIIPAWLDQWRKSAQKNKFFYWFANRFGISREQFIFVRKQAA